MYKPFTETRQNRSWSAANSHGDGCSSNQIDGYADEDENSGRQRYEPKKFAFCDTHSGHGFSHLAKLKLGVIPKISLPRGKLCKICKLEDL